MKKYLDIIKKIEKDDILRKLFDDLFEENLTYIKSVVLNENTEEYHKNLINSLEKFNNYSEIKLSEKDLVDIVYYLFDNRKR